MFQPNRDMFCSSFQEEYIDFRMGAVQNEQNYTMLKGSGECQAF